MISTDSVTNIALQYNATSSLSDNKVDKYKMSYLKRSINTRIMCLLFTAK